jgi:hypothetical protein
MILRLKPATLGREHPGKAQLLQPGQPQRVADVRPGCRIGGELERMAARGGEIGHAQAGRIWRSGILFRQGRARWHQSSVLEQGATSL